MTSRRHNAVRGGSLRFGNRRKKSSQKLRAAEDLFGLLADHLLVNILEKLPNSDREVWCLVCRRFSTVEASCRKKVKLLLTHVLQTVLRSYPNLEELDLSSYSPLDNCNLRTVGKLSGRCLRTLNLSPVHNVHQKYLEKDSNCGFHASGFTGTGLLSLVKLCPQLQHLDLSYCSQLADREFKAVARLTKLESLRLFNCEDIRDASLGCVVAGCRNLRSLNLGRCFQVTDRGILTITDGCHDLQDLDLTCCGYLTDQAMASIAASCKSIKCIKLAGCTGITDKGFVSLGYNCTVLEVVDLSYCSINDDGLESFAECSALRILKLINCMNITDVGIQSIAASCYNLREVDLSGSGRVGDIGKDALSSQCPRLK